MIEFFIDESMLNDYKPAVKYLVKSAYLGVNKYEIDDIAVTLSIDPLLDKQNMWGLNQWRLDDNNRYISDITISHINPIAEELNSMYLITHEYAHVITRYIANKIVTERNIEYSQILPEFNSHGRFFHKVNNTLLHYFLPYSWKHNISSLNLVRGGKWYGYERILLKINFDDWLKCSARFYIYDVKVNKFRNIENRLSLNNNRVMEVLK
jgi:hypothetical protein